MPIAVGSLIFSAIGAAELGATVVAGTTYAAIAGNVPLAGAAQPVSAMLWSQRKVQNLTSEIRSEAPDAQGQIA
jgi:hypothetical protein